MDRPIRRFRGQRTTFRLNWFIIGLVSLSFVAWFFHSIPPKEGSVVGLGIGLVVLTVLSFLLAFIENVRRVILFSSGVGIVLILRAAKLHDPLYLLLLLAFFGSLEFALRNR